MLLSEQFSAKIISKISLVVHSFSSSSKMGSVVSEMSNGRKKLNINIQYTYFHLQNLLLYNFHF